MSSPRHSPQPSAAAPRPRGILKNVASPSGVAPTTVEGISDEQTRLAWDESNLTLHEIQRQQQDPRMKIDEPKTPFVRSASIGSMADDDDDAFHLDNPPSSGQQLSSTVPDMQDKDSPQTRSYGADVLMANTKANASAATESKDIPNDADIRPGGLPRSRQGSSSRSPSFTLPGSRRSSASGGDRTRETLRNESNYRDGGSTRQNDDAAFDDEDSDGEQDEALKAKQEAFARKRNAHYGNEAEAMKIAAALAAKDDEVGDDSSDEAMEVGSAHFGQAGHRAPLPNGRSQ